MIRPTTLLGRTIACLVSFSLVSSAVPYAAFQPKSQPVPAQADPSVAEKPSRILKWK
jgi:hypothetical protein